MRLTSAQLTAIHTMRRRVMDDDTYRQMLADRYGCASTKDLSKAQARELIDYLQKHLTGDATPKQIRAIWATLKAAGFDEAAAIVWISKKIRKIHRLEELTRQEAAKAIGIANKMRKHYQNKTDPTPNPSPLQGGELPSSTPPVAGGDGGGSKGGNP